MPRYDPSSRSRPHLWRHGRSMSVGFSRDRTRDPDTTNKSLTVKFQWEV